MVPALYITQGSVLWWYRLPAIEFDAALHRAAYTDDGGQIKPGSGHQHAGYIFVQLPITPIRPAGELRP
jgi:hypothetical protein